MSSELDDNLKLLPQATLKQKAQTRVTSILFCINFCIALGAVVFCLYILITSKTYKKEQLHMQSSIQAMQELISKNKAETVSLPDNIAIVLQDTMNQLKEQKNSTKDLEGLVVSDLRPKIEFLLKEFELSQEQQIKVQQTALLAKDDINITAFLTYILSAAELNLVVIQDIEIAKNLLTFAEKILVNNHDEALIKLKAAITKDRQILLAINVPDKESIYKSLNTLIANVEQYTYKGQPELVPAPTAVETGVIDMVTVSDNSVDNKNYWRAMVQKVWHELRALIKVRRNHGAVPVLTAFAKETEVLQRVRLQMLLEQVRLASSSGKPLIYKESLAIAKSILTEHFVADNILNKQAIAELDSLMSINIKPDLPAHINSLQEFEAMLKMGPIQQ